MESDYPFVISVSLCFLFLLLRHLRFSNRPKGALPTNWPFVGMLFSLLVNLHEIHNVLTDILSEHGRTFVFHGPRCTNITNMLCTSDPANVRHVFVTNFSNYSKGSQFKECFDFFGDGLFNADGDSWRTQRQQWHRLFNQKQFRSFYEQYFTSKVQNGIVPVLEHVINRNMVVDLQDLFKRYTFDTTIMLLSGTDPCCLAFECEKNPCIEALDHVEEAMLHRHVMPASWSKLQRWLGTGIEKKLSEAIKCLDQFAAHCISANRERLQSKRLGKDMKEGDLLTSLLEDGLGTKSDRFLRDFMWDFMLAGTGTVATGLTWFFWLVSCNTRIETTIIEELKSKIMTAPEKEDCKKLKTFDVEELKGSSYLHAALCEALRLYPPVPYELRWSLEQDTLPSGHRVGSETPIIVSLYGMARMEEVWGKDCLEFKPERWISDDGGIKHVPSHKFLSFLTGPRTCLGKEIAFTQMKVVAATLLYNFQVEVVDSQRVSFKPSIMLYMTHGMKARIKSRF